MIYKRLLLRVCVCSLVVLLCSVIYSNYGSDRPVGSLRYVSTQLHVDIVNSAHTQDSIGEHSTINATKHDVDAFITESNNAPLNATRICTQAERKEHVRKMCKEVKIGYHSNKKYLVDDKHKIAYCGIPKVASSTWNKLFKLAQRTQPNIMSKFKSNHKRDVLEKFGLRFESNLTKLDGYKTLLVVRNPHTRLISAYLDKIASERDKDEHFRKIRSYLKDLELAQTRNKSRGTPVKFHTFVTKLMFSRRVPRRIRYDQHWAPYTTLCNPCAHPGFDYIFRVETMAYDSPLVLELLGLTQQDMQENSKNISPNKKQHHNETIPDFTTDLGSIVTTKRAHLSVLHELYGLEEDLFGYDLNVDTGKTSCAIRTADGEICC